MVLELRSQFGTFENSTNCNEISFDPHSLSELLKGLLWNLVEFEVVSRHLDISIFILY